MSGLTYDNIQITDIKLFLKKVQNLLLVDSLMDFSLPIFLLNTAQSLINAHKNQLQNPSSRLLLLFR